MAAEEEKKKPPQSTGIPKQIQTLTHLMNIRREDEAEPPYVLVLGAGASLSSGCSSGARVIADVVGQLSSKDVADLSWEEKITEFYDLLDNLSATERYTILEPHIVGQIPSPGYRCLAQLIKAGYFDIILSTNFDVFLEDALSDVGLRKRDFTVLISNRESEEQIVRALGFSKPRVKLVKLHGDLPARIFAFTPEEVFQFTSRIEQTLTDILNGDIIVVGHSLRDDDLNRCIRANDGALWYVNPTEPSVADFAGRAILARGTPDHIISGELGRFDDFFQALGEALLEAPAKATREEEERRQAQAEAEQKRAEETREREARLAELYAQAMKAKNWAQVISACEEIRTIDRRYKDVASLLKQARAEEKRERELASLYGQVVKAQDDQDWDTVIALCEEIQAIAPSYKDVAAILQEAKRVKEAREREERLATLYDKAEAHFRKDEWAQAVELYEQVLALEPGYRDIEAKLVEAQRQQRLADQYAQAQEHLQAQRWQEAIEGFRAVLEIDRAYRAYRAATTLLAEAKHQKELASLPEPPAAKPALPCRRKPTTLPV